MGEVNRPHVILLQGVFPEDVIRDESPGVDELMLRQITGASEPAVAYGGSVREHGRIPSFYTTKEEHEIDNPVRCWYCHDYCKEFVWFVPEPLPEDHRARWGVRGAYCSFPCAAGGLRAEFHAEPVYRKHERALRELISEVHSVRVCGHVWAAPDPHMHLLEFGRGTMTRQDYRRELASLTHRTLAAAKS